MWITKFQIVWIDSLYSRNFSSFAIIKITLDSIGFRWVHLVSVFPLHVSVCACTNIFIGTTLLLWNMLRVLKAYLTHFNILLLHFACTITGINIRGRSELVSIGQQRLCYGKSVQIFSFYYFLSCFISKWFDSIWFRYVKQHVANVSLVDDGESGY